MPQISTFLGIVIKMFFRDHNPPHFHAEYGEFEGLIDIDKLDLMVGTLPPRVLGLVIEWAALHQRELLTNWNKARKNKKLDRIKPLV